MSETIEAPRELELPPYDDPFAGPDPTPEEITAIYARWKAEGRCLTCGALLDTERLDGLPPGECYGCYVASTWEYEPDEP
jgi:hypothetical protein